MLTIYDGGSSKDEVLSFWSTLYYTSSGNQIFIMITNDGDGSGINFSASYKSYCIIDLLPLHCIITMLTLSGLDIYFLPGVECFGRGGRGWCVFGGSWLVDSRCVGGWR